MEYFRALVAGAAGIGVVLTVAFLVCICLVAGGFIFALGFVVGSVIGGTAGGVFGGILCVLLAIALMGGSLS